MAYVSRIIGDHGAHDQNQLQQQILSHLHAARSRDMALGHTSVGPHRDDIAFFINGHDAGSAASRGETRTIVLSLKFLEIEQLLSLSDRIPVLLLDDVFSELDASRREALLRATTKCQIIITTTDADVIGKPDIDRTVRHIKLEAN